MLVLVHCKPLERYREQLMSVRVIPEFYIMVQCAMPIRNQALSTGQTTVWRDAALVYCISTATAPEWVVGVSSSLSVSGSQSITGLRSVAVISE